MNSLTLKAFHDLPDLKSNNVVLAGVPQEITLLNTEIEVRRLHDFTQLCLSFAETIEDTVSKWISQLPNHMVLSLEHYDVNGKKTETVHYRVCRVSCVGTKTSYEQATIIILTLMVEEV